MYYPFDLNHDAGENQDRFRQMGAIPFLIQVMKTHKGFLALQYEACGAIVHLALNSNFSLCAFDALIFLDENRQILFESGALEQIIEVLREHSYDIRIQNHGFGALLNLSLNGNFIFH